MLMNYGLITYYHVRDEVWRCMYHILLIVTDIVPSHNITCVDYIIKNVIMFLTCHIYIDFVEFLEDKCLI